MENLPAIDLTNGAHHYRFVGIEVQPGAGFYQNDLIRVGTGYETSLSALPQFIEFDRVFVHGNPDVGGKRGIALNGRDTVIKNSYVSDWKSDWQHTQALAGWNGPGPFTITNNYIEAAGENINFGGGTTSVSGVIPSDILIKNNLISKPLSWKSWDPSYAGKRWFIANHIELKNAQRVRIENNVLENNWTQGDQRGFSMQLTVRWEDGRVPWATVADVSITGNIIRHSGAGINVYGREGQGTKRLTIRDNVFEDLNEGWGGDGSLLLMNGGENVTFEHNTAFHTGWALIEAGAKSPGLIFNNNIVYNVWGIQGEGTNVGIPTLDYYNAPWDLRRNLFINGMWSQYPQDNLGAPNADQVGFVNRAGGDYRLAASSPFRGKGTDGKDLGADMAVVFASASAPAPAPAPAVTVAVTPSTATIQAGGTQQFTATVSNSSNQGVTWTASAGTISATGLYTAPNVSSPTEVQVTATSAADSSKSAVATLTVNPAPAPAPTPVTISVTPNTGTINNGDGIQLSASVSGSSNGAVTWTATLGSVSASGYYIAPVSVTAPTQVQVRATSVADPSKSAVATITVNPKVGLSITPWNPTVRSGGTVQFNTVVTGTTNQNVMYLLSPAIGTITPAGLYTAGQVSAPRTITLIVRSRADFSLTARVLITIQP
jgi:hypothetical protein